MGKQIPVTMFCPITETETDVFWPVIVLDGKEYIDRNKFDGCDGQFSGCQECWNCQKESYEKLMGK